MKCLAAFLLIASTAAAYTTPPDEVLVDGRILRTAARPLATFPWRGTPRHLSEHPGEGIVSDSREIAAIWEIKDGRLYLLAVSTYQHDAFAPLRSLGLRDLTPERLHDGRVPADWFTGEFDVIEMERVDRRLLLQLKNAPPMRVKVRKFRVEKGRVTEEPEAGADGAGGELAVARGTLRAGAGRCGGAG